LTTEGVRVERDGPVGIVVLDRPEFMNRLEGLMRESLQGVLHMLARDDAIRCLVITGAGEAFSAGADVEELIDLHQTGRVEEIGRRVRLGAEIVDTLRNMEKPVVAAVNGVAAGAGCNLALACDIRIGSERAVFVESFVRVGLVPDWGGFQNLVRLVGAARAVDMMMTGARVEAAEAHAIGILQRLCPEVSFWDDAMTYAQRLAAGPPEALALIKRGVQLAAAPGPGELTEFEASAQEFLFSRPNSLEGLQAFVEKRHPQFVGASELPSRWGSSMIGRGVTYDENFSGQRERGQ
jgi:2-(1,2-epoxy-1,2-dihydrophenyl)acetyl-CoA isomerase